MKLKRALGFILMIMVVMLYGCGSGGENKSAKITSVNLETTGVTVDVDSVVELPKFAVASWNDGSETSVGIIWDKTTVDTSKVSEGIVYTGTVTGWDGKIVYTVTVIKGQEEYITEAYLISNTATVDVGSNFTLPTKAMVKWSIGTETEAVITWDKTVNTSKEGTYTFKGKVEGYDAGNLIYTLIVKKGITPKITSVYLPTASNTVRQNSVFSLPTQGKAVWSNGDITDIALTWDKAADTSKLGTTIYEATATGTTFKVQYSLTVGPEPILVPKRLTLELETVTVDVASEYELPKYGKVTMSDGAIKTVELKWNNTTVDTSKEGIYIYVASYTENKVTVTKVMTLIVGGEVKIEKLTLTSNEVTVSKGTSYTLPVTATAVYTDGTEAEVVLTWDKKADTSKEGKYTFTGTAKETTQKVILTLIVGTQPETITGLSIKTDNSKVNIGVTFTLPAKGTAVLSDGTEKEVDLTWDKEVDTSKEGTYTFIGKTSGSMLEVTYTLKVGDYKTELQSLTLTPKSASVAINATYTLPTKGTAVYTDGTEAEVDLTWDKKADTSKAGIFTYTASYTEEGIKVKTTFVLTVADKTVTGFTISKVDDIAGIGTVYTLPKTGIITYTDETTEEVTVTWDKSVNTAVAGKYTFTGTNTKAGTLKVTFVLTVKTVSTPVLTMSDISNVKAGDTIEVAVNASFFTKTVAAIDVRLNYDTTMLKGLDDATMVVSGMKIVKHIGNEQDVSVVLDTPTVISGTLFKVKFKVLKDGKTSIKFAEGTEFLGAGAEKIAMDTTDTGEVGVGIITDNSTLTLSDWTGTTNDTAEVTVKAEGFTETSLGFDITLNYDTKYLDINADNSNITIINSDLWSDLLIVTKPEAGKVKITITTKDNVKPIVLNGDLFKVKFKSTGVATAGTTVSFGEVRVANSTDGYQKSVTTIDTANVVVSQGEITTGAFEIADATGIYPGYATVVLSGKDFKEEASGVEFILNYDSNYLEVENVSTDVTLTGALASGRIIPIVTTAGKLKIAAEIDNKTFTANGNLVTIKFKTKKTGKSGLSFANVDLGNAAASGKIAATTTDTANVTVTEVIAKATSVELTASSTSFTAGGSTTLTAVVKDQNGNVMSGEAADIYNGTSKVGSSTYSFSSSTEGTYTFTAKSGTLTSAAVTVTVNQSGGTGGGTAKYFEYGPYKVNPNGKVGVYKTGMEVLKPKQLSGAIAGNASYVDWTEDMLICQGAGFDDCKSFRGHHETPSNNPYTLYATWDDTNLYIGIQYVYLNDVFDTSNMKGDSSWPTWGQGTMILAFDTNSKWSTGLTAAGTNPWGGLKGFTLTEGMGVDTLFYFSSNPAAVNSAVFLANDSNLMTRKKADAPVTYKSEMEDLGIVYGACNGSFATNIWGYGGSGIAGLETMSNFKDCASHDRKGLDIFYEMKIPFTALGITKEQLTSNGIGVMYMATNGQSPIDSLPHDPATVDNAEKPYAQDESSSAEKDDCDNFTTGLARIGKK